MKPDCTTTTHTSPSLRSSSNRHELHPSIDDDDCNHGLVEVESKDADEETGTNNQVKSDKKTDEIQESQKANGEEKKAGGYLWRFSSSVIGTTTGAVTGAVGLGFGGIKWVASKGYNAGSAVVDTTKSVAGKVPVPTWKKKDKKE